jgi:hypothetical protein
VRDAFGVIKTMYPNVEGRRRACERCERPGPGLGVAGTRSYLTGH